MIIYAKHPPYEDGHLGEVTSAMDEYGPPVLKIVEFEGNYCALEGSHRLAICDHFNVVPLLLVEVADLDETTASFWRKVIPTLPKYDMTAYVMSSDILIERQEVDYE